MSVITMRKLLESGSHFGHQTRRWNPKMKPFIYTSKAGTHIIDLNITIDHVERAYEAMKAIGERGGKVLFVGTKKQAQAIVLDEALRSGSFFINQRWLGGLLTNFRTIQKSIRRLIEIEEMEANGSINVYPKKEIIQLRKEATRLETFLGGIKEMKKLPDAVFVVDPTEDTIAVMEAKKLKIPVFGFIDTNCDPELVDYGIPANDDAIRSIRTIVGLMADALIEPKGGVMTIAYQDQEQEDITMTDVIVNVERQNEESERRRRQRMEERRNRQDRRRPYDNNRRPQRDTYSNRDDQNPTRATEAAPARPVEAKPVEAKPVEAKPVEAKPVEAKPVEAKPVEAKVEAVVEAKPVETKVEAVVEAPVEAKPKATKAKKVETEVTSEPKAKAVKAKADSASNEGEEKPKRVRKAKVEEASE